MKADKQILDFFLDELARTMDVYTSEQPDDICAYEPDASDFDQELADYNEYYSLL